MRQNVRLARPLAALHAGQQLMNLVDAALLGRLGNAPLAGAGIGGNLFWAVTVLGIGLMLGIDPLLSQAVGAGEARKARRLLRDAVVLGLWLSLPLALVLGAVPLLLRPAGVEEE